MEFTLGIETSCDETAAAVLQGEREVLSNVVYSQADLHSRYGGVVPEIASRNHLRKLPFILKEALTGAGVEPSKIDLIGATFGPGLVGALLVGLSAAKGLAYALKRPFVGVNHLEAHLFAHYLEYPQAGPPLLALLVSGGHTNLVHIKAWGDYRTLGGTRDDAAGEAFDKVGKLIGIDYPAGAKLDRLAKAGDPEAIPLPRPMLDSGYDFSFAGLKTAMAYYLKGHKAKPEDVAASFQRAVVDVLVGKTLRAATDLQVKRIAVVGGVAANSELRARFQAEAAGLEVYFPPLILCTDNAAMVAAAARFRHEELGQADPLTLSPEPGLRL
ncbi:MAG: tRNA (adenosine(37)-N6)-threonylcarbamoyltransferase complex transferase subunit TsaD [Candidatus Acetothermia bacterium]|jgi:N6-L-threonylcarbamoyladenine synthase|nr:tRNA (adenosine(37)-N6)-threonylcarbamoyltransferase complex transferase subunit TsaD [Candidatus Acetothermia bacterium]MDH7506090.1 tRNA (adenosine(37)-N6)-threonylcarbamoyltransferase complex transferase subunit TsaD [Candidatus Acetothermia bacterium]